MKPLQVDLSYPSLENVKKDLNSANIIMPSYSGLHGELSAILCYVYHSFYAKASGDNVTAELLKSIALCEMNHVNILGELILKLGKDPVYISGEGLCATYYNTSLLSYSKTLPKMLYDDISGEILAVKNYDDIIAKLENDEYKSIIIRIKLDEELHISALKERINQLNSLIN